MPKASEDIEARPFERSLYLAPHPFFPFQSGQFLSVLQWLYSILSVPPKRVGFLRPWSSQLSYESVLRDNVSPFLYKVQVA
jgi:hypothetical protein